MWSFKTMPEFLNAFTQKKPEKVLVVPSQPVYKYWSFMYWN